jgi:hypothetical protein
MAKLITVVQTYFSDGTYRNNRVEMQIPNEAAEIIKKYWQEKQIHNCTEAKYLALNQAATVDLKDDEDNLLCGMHNIATKEQDKNETFEHSFVDDEEDDRD